MPQVGSSFAEVSADSRGIRLRPPGYGGQAGQGALYHDAVVHIDNPEEAALRALIDEYRNRCLWFLAPGYQPHTVEEKLRVLDHIQRHGDVNAFRRAGAIRQWVLATSNAASASS